MFQSSLICGRSQHILGASAHEIRLATRKKNHIVQESDVPSKSTMLNLAEVGEPMGLEKLLKFNVETRDISPQASPMHRKSKVDGFLCLCNNIPPLRLIFFAGGSIDSKGCFIIVRSFLRWLEAEEPVEDEKKDRSEDVLDFVEVEDDIVCVFE